MNTVDYELILHACLSSVYSRPMDGWIDAHVWVKKLKGTFVRL